MLEEICIGYCNITSNVNRNEVFTASSEEYGGWLRKFGARELLTLEGDEATSNCGSKLALLTFAATGFLTPLTRSAFATVGFDLSATPLVWTENAFAFNKLDCFAISLLCAGCGPAAAWTVAFGVTTVVGVAMSPGRSPSRIITVESWAPGPDVEESNIPLMVWR